MRGEPEEKSRVQVAYATSKSPYNDENVNLLKPDELPENTVKENEEATVKPNKDDSSESSHSDKEDADSDDMEVTDENGTRVRRVVTKTVTTTSTKTASDNGEPKHLTRETLQMEGGQAGGDTDDNTEVMEYVDENGRRVRRIVKKTITTTSTKTPSDNGEPKHLTLQIEGGQAGGDTDDNNEVMEYVDENGRRVRRIVKKTITTSSKTSSDNGEPKHLTLQMEGGQGGGDKDDNTEVMEYVDENGRRVRRIVKKTMTTTSTRITSNNDGPSSVTTETREISSGGHGPEKILINFGGGMPRPSEEHSQLQLQPDIKPTAVQEKEVFLQFGSQPPAKQESRVNVDIKRQPFQIRDINLFEGGGNTTITNGSPGGNSTVNQRTVITKTIGSGDGGTKVVEHSTKTFSHGDDHPIMVVKKEKSQIDVPDRSSPETKRKNPDMSDISVHLKYPSDDAPKKRDLESSANESRIHPEVAKQDKPVITMLSLDDVVKQKEKGEEKPAPPQPSVDDEEEEEDEEDDEEVDEFEEEIVIMEVRRKPRFHKALEIPKREPEKTGIPIEDLLELPTFGVGQESAPDENLIDEQVEFEERPQTVYEAPNFEEFFKD